MLQHHSVWSYHSFCSHKSKDMGGKSSLFSQPWRELPKKNKENHRFLNYYQPRNNEVSHLRILLHGPVGAGKSSFINSVDSALQGRVLGGALTDGAHAGSSFTKKYQTFKIPKDAEHFYSFVLNDIMGLEQKDENGVQVEDIKMALKGHLRDDYRFNPAYAITEGDPSYNPSPNLNDKVHVLISVIPINSISLLSDEVMKKMRDIRLAASEMGIPQFAILTKVDEACPDTKKDINNVYKSKYLKEQFDKFSVMSGISPNCIFLVKNYESELETQDSMDTLILTALCQMINYGEDFLNNM